MTKFREKWEDDMIKNVPLAAESIKKKLPELREKSNYELLNDMKNGNIDNTRTINVNNSNDNSNSKDLSNEKVKVRTLTRDNKAPKVIDISNSNNNTNVSNNIYTEYRDVPSENPFESLRNNGNASASTVLIVIASFVIVAMLIVICLTLLGTFGVNP